VTQTAHPRAGQPAQPSDLIDVDVLVSAYYDRHPDPGVAEQRVAFGTSGHRGSSLNTAFNEDHIVAVAQAVVDHRRRAGVTGPLFVGRDTHALSEPAWASTLEVLVANDVTVLVDARAGYTPTPALSHAILRYNAGRTDGLADGIVVTPSHNPPADGGIKYNPPDGGPADSSITKVIEDRANDLLAEKLAGVRRTEATRARAAAGTYDFLGSYVDDLPSVLDLALIRTQGVRIGADPLGGAAVAYWEEIATRHHIDLTVVNTVVDPAFGFMTLDWDGKIRMDCSSPFAMASLIGNRSTFDVAVGNDADADRHGIVTPDRGLMNPNHYLSVAIDYLLRHRDGWPGTAGIGKTVVSSSMIDRVVRDLGRPLLEVPVGFKWFVPGLRDGSIAFGGEESAGASFLRTDGTVWTTDKDGILLCLLAAEITAATGASPSRYYAGLTERFGDPAFARIDAPANAREKAVLSSLKASDVPAADLAGEPVAEVITAAPGNGASIGGVKVSTASGWFAARPSGTEDVYKIYAESFQGPEHLARIQDDAQAIVAKAFGS